MTTNTLSLLERCREFINGQKIQGSWDLLKEVESAIAEERSVSEASADEIIDFLKGESTLDGVWFGDPHPTRKGSFWWRKLLPDSLAQPSQVNAQEPVGYIGGEEEHGVNSYVDAHFVKVTGGQFPFKNPIPVYTSPQPQAPDLVQIASDIMGACMNGYLDEKWEDVADCLVSNDFDGLAKFTSPQLKPLSDEEIDDVIKDSPLCLAATYALSSPVVMPSDFRKAIRVIARAIEAKLGVWK